MRKVLNVAFPVNNVPESLTTGWMVTRQNGTELWYYGIYETEERALKVAHDLGNGLVSYWEGRDEEWE